MTHHTHKKKLHAKSTGVAHHSSKRTRLRVPKTYRKRSVLKKVDEAVSGLPGVKSVEVNHETGSVLIHHEDEPGVLERITEALDETCPDILLALLEPEIAVPKLFSEFMSNFLHGNGSEQHNGGEQDEKQAAGDAVAAKLETLRPVKNYVPMAFVGLGVLALVEEGTLIGATAPIALFYYAFDFYWKLQQEKLMTEAIRPD